MCACIRTHTHAHAHTHTHTHTHAHTHTHTHTSGAVVRSVRVSRSYSCGRDLAHDHAPKPVQAALDQLAEAASQQVHIPSVVAKQQKEKDRVEDLTHTADAHRRCVLLAQCFTAWVHFVAMARKTAKTKVWLP